MERQLPALRIGELAHRTGTTIATLRAWESRYRLLRPSRTAGGQRLYSIDDETRVREVQRLIADGVAVGAAARWVADGGTTPARLVAEAGNGEAVAASRGDVASALAADVALGTAGGEGRTVTAVAPYRAGVVASGGRAEVRGSSDVGDSHLAQVHQTTRAMVHAQTPADVVAVLAGYIRAVGGSLVDAQIDDAVLPVDVSFGEHDPQLPRAEPMSLARMYLEQSLPSLVEDARRIIDLLRRAAERSPD